MRRTSAIFSLCTAFLVFSSIAFGQLTGVKTIDNSLPTAGDNYASFTDAFVALNASGVGAGGVTFNVASGQTFTERPDTLTASGTAGNPIVFQKSGVGVNPKIIPSIAGTVASSTTLGSHGDAIIVLKSGDYITFNGIDLQTDAAFSGAGMMEYGYYLKKVSATDACKNITIQNCAVTLNKAAIYSFGIFVSNISGTATVTVTSTGGRSENIKLYNNSISNCYGGIQIRGYAASSPYDFYDQNIEVGHESSGNSITNFGGGASTAYGIYAIYQNNLKLGGNTINGGSGTTTTVYGIFTSTGTSSNVDIFSNTVTIAGGGTTSTLYGINNGMGSTAAGNTVNIYNNTITGCTYPTATTAAVYLLYSTSTPSKINMYGNTISGNTIPGTGTMYCLYESGSVVDSVKIYNNTVINNTRSATGSLYCIYNSPASTAKCEIFDNSVHGNTSAGGTIYSIYNGEGTDDNIYRNIVYDQSTTAGTSPVVYGIYTTSADTTRIFNNYISDLRATTSTSANAVSGIYISGGTKVGGYFNTVFLNASSTSETNFGTSGVYASTTPTVDLRSNVVVNLSTPGPAGGFTVAYRRSSSTLTTYESISNNNDFYVNPGLGVRRYYYSDGTAATNCDSTLTAFKSRVSPCDGNTVAENPPFINATSTPYNLHIDTATPTQLESGGVPVTTPVAITTDYDGNSRNSTTPDIGADEFAGTIADLTGPTITYTPLSNTASTSNRSVSGIDIADVSGVNIAAGTRPRLYYKRSTDANTVNDNTSGTDGWKYAEAIGGGGTPFSFTIDYSRLNGGTGVAGGQIIQYFIVAQDLASTANVGINNGIFNATPSSVALTATAFPLTGGINSYTIAPLLSGTYTVGAGGDYANLTAVANLLNNHNSEVVGNVIFELTATYDGTTETVPIVFNEFINASLRTGLANTVTIRPALGVTGRVTSGDPGSNFAYPVINFVGADYFILDGRPGGIGSSNEWTIRNTRSASTIGCVIRFADDATHDLVRNLNIEGQATLTTTGVVFFHTSTGTVGNSFDTVMYCNIRGRTDVPNAMSNGILSNGSTAAPNSFNVIVNNHIIDFNNIGVSLVSTSTGNGPNWVISDNHFYNTTISTSAQTGISIASTADTNMTISGNFIGGSGASATGLWQNSGNVIITGIAVSNGISNITGNTIGNISGTNTGTSARTRGIYITSPRDSILITNNVIYNLSTQSSVVTGLSAGSQAVAGISIWSGATFYTTTITGNTIYNLSAENTTALTSTNVAAGMFLTNFSGVAANNSIYNIKNKSTGTTAGQPPVAAGILARYLSNAYLVNNMISVGAGENTNTQFNGIMAVVGESANHEYFYHNTVSVSGTAGGDIGSFAFLRSDNTTTSPKPSLHLYNNILSNTRTGGTSVNYAIGLGGTNDTLNLFSNYNDLTNADASTIGLINATNHTLATWQSATAGDANSVSYATTFVSPTNLHLSNVHNGDMNLKGVAIAGVSVDFDNQTRDAQAPYMGADELSIALPIQLASFTARLNQNGSSVLLDWRTLSEVNNYGFYVQRKRQGETDFQELPNSFVAGHGTTYEPHDYVFVDASLVHNGFYFYRLRQQDLDGASHLTEAVSVNVTTLTDVPEQAPREFSLQQNYPNPFNPETVIKFSVENTAKATLEVFNMLGQKVMTLFDDVAEAGQYYRVNLTGVSLATGTYVYRLQSGSRVDVKKMLLLK